MIQFVMLMNTPSSLSDEELAARVLSLAASERAATASLILHLAELEARNLHLAQGFKSLFGYCRHVLHCSEHESYNRMQAVHAARRFAVILPMLEAGVLHLTAIRLLAPHLKDEDHLALLGGAFHKSKREIVILLARWYPVANIATSIRKLPTPTPTAPRPQARGGAVGGVVAAAGPDAETTSRPTPEPTPEAAPVQRTGREAHRAVVAPLAAERYRLQVTMEEDSHGDLRFLQESLRRDIPDGDVSKIVARALRLLRRETERKAFSATSRPRSKEATTRASADSRHIPAAVARAVWQRDDGRCAFLGTRSRCEERSFLEYHHLKP